MKTSKSCLLFTFAILAAPAALDAQVLNEQVARMGEAPNLDTDLTGVQRDSFTAPANYEFFAIYHAKDHNGWGDDPAQPNMHRIDGCRAVIDDLQSSTANQFRVHVYAENGTTNLPNVATRQTAGTFLTPTQVAGGQATWVLNIAFTPPLFVTNAGDVYIGIEFLAETATDFLRMGFVSSNVAGTLPNFDVSNNRFAATGHGLGANGGYGYARALANPTTFFYSDDQFLISPLGRQAGFKVAMTTTQTTMPHSNPAAVPGYTTSLFSSRKPAMLVDRTGAPRAAPDSPVLIFQDRNRAAADPIAFFMGPTVSGLPAPISVSFIAGWTGRSCLPSLIPPIQVGVGVLDPNKKFVLPLTGVTNGGLVGLDFAFTGIALDVVNGTVHLGGCELVQFG